LELVRMRDHEPGEWIQLCPKSPTKGKRKKEKITKHQQNKKKKKKKKKTHPTKPTPTNPKTPNPHQTTKKNHPPNEKTKKPPPPRKKGKRFSLKQENELGSGPTSGRWGGGRAEEAGGRWGRLESGYTQGGKSYTGNSTPTKQENFPGEPTLGEGEGGESLKRMGRNHHFELHMPRVKSQREEVAMREGTYFLQNRENGVLRTGKHQGRNRQSNDANRSETFGGRGGGGKTSRLQISIKSHR